MCDMADVQMSTGSAAESAPLERRASINSPHTLPPVLAAVGELHRAGSTPASMSKSKPGGSRPRRGDARADVEGQHLSAPCSAPVV